MKLTQLSLNCRSNLNPWTKLYCQVEIQAPKLLEFKISSWFWIPSPANNSLRDQLEFHLDVPISRRMRSI